MNNKEKDDIAYIKNSEGEKFNIEFLQKNLENKIKIIMNMIQLKYVIQKCKT